MGIAQAPGSAGGGPLTGLRIVEIAGLGAGPFCAMMLADMGADVVRIDRPGAPGDGGVLGRNRRAIEIDLKSESGLALLFELIRRADGLIEAFRPGVAERLGFGPTACLGERPSLIYGRATGWGQVGPWRMMAGHDINYIALSGMLHAMGRADAPPAPPLNLVGDFGGGAMMLAFGVVCAVLEARQSGKGQVVDAAMTDGAALLGAMMYGLRGFGMWRDEREANLLDGGAPFYGTYACADGKFIAIGAIEPQFYDQLLALVRAEDPAFANQWTQRDWPQQKDKFAALFSTRTRDAWCALLEGTDACFAPVLDMAEAPDHPHNRARGTFVEVAGVRQPAPAPRFSRTQPGPVVPPSAPGEDSVAILAAWGWTREAIDLLQEANVL
jgi:alpha-methylacyl-CoA racemase